MRIALLSSDWRPTGGVATYVRAVAAALAEAGHDVAVIHGEQEAEEAGLPFRLAAVPGAFQREAAGDAARSAAVVRLVDEFNPDVVHVQSNNNFPLEHLLGARRPTIKTYHVHDYCPSGTKYHFGPNRACRVPTGILCVPRMALLRCTLTKARRDLISLSAHTAGERSPRAYATHRLFIT